MLVKVVSWPLLLVRRSLWLKRRHFSRQSREPRRVMTSLCRAWAGCRLTFFAGAEGKGLQTEEVKGEGEADAREE